jgi:LCP family protein required for cell wall assembly
MKSQKIKILVPIALTIGVAAAAVIGFAAIAQRWSQPLSEGAALPTFAPTGTPTPIQNRPAGEGNPNMEVIVKATDTLAEIEVAPTATPLPPGKPTPVPLCGGPPVMTMLGIGIDTEDLEYYYGLGDVIRIVRIDFVTPKVSALSLPRDIWVEIPGISDHYGITHGKLNQSYLYGTKGMGYYDGPGGGAGLMALTLVHNFGLYVDHFGIGNMAAVSKMIDVVGGIDITLEQGIDGSSVDMDYLEAGIHHFNGNQAVQYSRIRNQDSDLHRINRQTQVLYSLLEKVRDPAVLPQIPNLMNTLDDVVITDLSLADLNQLRCLIPHINEDNLLIASLPKNLLQEDRQWDPHQEADTWVYRADFEAIRTLLVHFQNGNWPTK